MRPLPRFAAAAGVGLGSCALAIAVALSTPTRAPLLLLLGLTGAALVVGATRVAPLLGLGLAAMGAEITLAAQGTGPGVATVAFAAALVLLAEIAGCAGDRSFALPPPWGRLLELAVAGAAALALGAALLGGLALRRPEAPADALLLAGAAATVALFLPVVSAAWRPHRTAAVEPTGRDGGESHRARR